MSKCDPRQALNNSGRTQGFFLDQRRPRGWQHDRSVRSRNWLIYAGRVGVTARRSSMLSYQSVLATECQISFRYFACVLWKPWLCSAAHSSIFHRLYWWSQAIWSQVCDELSLGGKPGFTFMCWYWSHVSMEALLEKLTSRPLKGPKLNIDPQHYLSTIRSKPVVKVYNSVTPSQSAKSHLDSLFLYLCDEFNDSNFKVSPCPLLKYPIITT